MEQQQLKNIIEGALLAYDQVLTVDKLQSLFLNEASHEKNDDGCNQSEQFIPSKTEITELLLALQEDFNGCGYELKQVASGWRLQVREELAPWINRLWEEKPQRYSRALLETLAIIAYRQPITRGDIEEIRGVAVSSHIIKTLSEREWVKVVGHRDVPGRPSLYATTRQFLDYFNLASLDELPSLRELADVESLTPELDLKPVDQGNKPSAQGEKEPSAQGEKEPLVQGENPSVESEKSSSSQGKDKSSVQDDKELSVQASPELTEKMMEVE